MGAAAARSGPVQAGTAGYQQRQPGQRERQENQQEEVAAVGEQQLDLATGHHPDLLLHGEPRREAARVPPPMVGRSGQRRRAVRAGAHPCDGLWPVTGAHRGLDLCGWPREGQLAGRSE